MDAVVEAFGFEGEVIVSFHTQTVSAVIFTVDKSFLLCKKVEILS